MIKWDDFRKKNAAFLDKLSAGGPGIYKNCVNGEVTLYASCFALMSYYYLDMLKSFSNYAIDAWAEYILARQDADGLFRGPEIISGKLLSNAHSPEHLAWHSTCHVLPALSIINRKPEKPLLFFLPYLESRNLIEWLEMRNWDEPWLEGNNLLFMGQLYTYFIEMEKSDEARHCLNTLFDWLNERIDTSTGLWGTDKGSNNYSAAYGAYHQLILYNYWNREIGAKEVLIDTILSLQHFDGGFSADWGGGSCEDVDCVDILVNMYKAKSHRKTDIEQALMKNAFSVLRRMHPEGGFMYKLDEDFYHMGMEYTYCKPNQPNIFSTWFGLHTLMLISEIIDIKCLHASSYNFNNSCSMGWHRKWSKTGKTLIK